MASFCKLFFSCALLVHFGNAISAPRRFIREFDKADRDPSQTAARLARFENTLRKLFVEGYIMVPAGSSGSEPPAASQEAGDAKTLTEIVMEQLEDMAELRYGSKTVVLWNGTKRKEVEASLQEIGQIVEDCLQRLHVDFSGADLYMSLEAMDINSWTDATGSRQLALRSKARQLCNALGVAYTWDSWKEAIRQVERMRRRRSDAKDVDNRVLWVNALSASRGQTDHSINTYAPVIDFFASVTDGSGSIERYLGCHAAFLAHHQGGPDNDMAAVCVEVAREGPAEERSLFRKDPDRPEVHWALQRA